MGREPNYLRVCLWS